MPAPDTPRPTERTAGVFPHANTRRENRPYDPRKMNKTAPIVCLLLTCVLPGCVIGDIRDELGTANRQLTDLDSAVSDLDKIRLANLEEQLVILKAIDDNLTAYYRLMNVIHTQGYTHADSVEAMRNFYGNYPGLSDINEAARRTILRYIGNFLGNISVEDYSEYFELSKIFPIYTDLFGNQQFNQSLKAICLRYIKRLLKRFTDKRGKDYQDIKKFVNTSFIDLGFMKPKELVEMFKTKRKKKSTTA